MSTASGTPTGSSSRKFDLKAFAFFVLLTLAAGFLGGALGGMLNGGMSFDELVKPPLTPPAWVFPVVWSILYVLMGITAYLVYHSDDLDRSAPLRMYLLQLIVNILWPLFFFRLEWRLFAFFWLLLLIALVTLTMVGFKHISLAAYYLMIPYLLWILFAAYLNLAFYLLNT